MTSDLVKTPNSVAPGAGTASPSVSLAGRRLLVTGGARGLGLACAEAACQAGAAVVLADLREVEGQAAAKRLQAAGYSVSFITLDLTRPDSIEACVKHCIDTMGGIDGLLNNGAVTDSGGKMAPEIEIATWDAVMSVNVRGTWLMTMAALPSLRQSGRGAVLNLASDTALWGAPRLLAYVASKGAIIAMTRSLARELGGDGITVNAIAPGLVEVEATAYVPAERHTEYRTRRAIQRAQVPDDVTGPVLFLLSDAARFVTGQLLPVNGGFVMN